jgi:hypothetical protein
MSRCIDESIGIQVLSYDLLAGAEKRAMDAHLEACAACRDLKQQTFGSEGALDELDWRVWRLSRRRRVEPHAWMMDRLRDLWMPFLAILVCFGIAALIVARARRGGETVGILSLAVSRAGIVEENLTQRIGPYPEAVLVRTDRAAQALVYEVHASAMRRLVPGADGAPITLQAGETREVVLPPLENATARVVLLLAPAHIAAGMVQWDAAMMEYLGRGRRARWPNDAQPTLRWIQ